jgi:hypothetical protein
MPARRWNRSLKVVETPAENISIYPNPVTDKIYVEVNGTVSDIRVVDLSGNTVLRIYPGAGVNSLDVSGLNRGLYVLVVQTGDRVITKKFVKQ